MSSSPEMSLFDLHSENQAQATTANNLRWAKYKKVLTWTPIIVLILGLWYQWRSPFSSWNTEPTFTAAPTPATVPVTPEEQARRVAVAKQEAEVLAAQQATWAEADAKAAEASRLVLETTKNLPITIKVAECSPDGTSWSQTVEIPNGWFVEKSWGGKHVKTQILLEGKWQDLTQLNKTGEIAAVRYCTTSQANLELRKGMMDLTWKAL